MILIIGYGNVLRGDDGIGWHAAHLLREEFTADDVVQIVACHQLTPELAETLSRADVAIFLDSEVCPSCDLRCAPLIPLDPEPNALTHHVKPGNLLAMARALYGQCPRAFVVSMGGAFDFDCGSECSPRVREMLPEMVSLTCCLVAWAKNIAQENRTNSSANAISISMSRRRGSLLDTAAEVAVEVVQGG